MGAQLEIFVTQKPRDTFGRFATQREADLSKREKRISFLERQHIIDQRKIEALIKLNEIYQSLNTNRL